MTDSAVPAPSHEPPPIDPTLEAALLAAAAEACQSAYAPYSHFQVGAAVLAGSGRVYRGCNVENASYGLTICAERSAVCAAVAAGERVLVAVAIVATGDQPAMPCGACRQVLHEFGPRMLVVSRGLAGSVRRVALTTLLPAAFGPADLTG